MKELWEIVCDVGSYIGNAFIKVKPFLIFLWSAISYVIFPDKAYIPAALAVSGAMVLDIFTKYYALMKPHRSFIKAIKAGAISSNSFFDGTKKKLISFMVLMIMCGLSYRVAPIAGVTVFLGTIVYSVMFLRECQSCVENLIQAGHDDLRWLLLSLRRKEKNILDKDSSDEGESGTGNTQNINIGKDDTNASI